MNLQPIKKCLPCVLIIPLWLSMVTVSNADLVAHWPLNEGDGDSFAELIGGNDGFLPGGSGFEWGEGPTLNGVPVQDNAVRFLGENGTFIATEFPGIGGNNPRTVAFWAKTLDADAYFLGWGRNASGEKWHIRLNGGSGVIRTEYQGGQNFAGQNLIDGEWHHIASVFPEGATEGGEILHYIDGVLDPRTGGTSIPINTAAGDGSADFADGNSAGSYYVHFGAVLAHGFGRTLDGSMADVRIYDEELDEGALLDIMAGIPPTPFEINGSGESYFQDFDSMETGRLLPRGWKGEDTGGTSRRADSLGLVDGPLAGAVETAEGIVNVGGNADRFSSPADGRIGTWKDDLDGNDTFNDDDVIADGATDRALGSSRVNADDPGALHFEIAIGNKSLRALVLDWDLEIWGGDPEGTFRGTEGAGFVANLDVGGTNYYTETVTVHPGNLFDSAFDLSPGATHDPTLINGNEHSARGNTSDIVEVSSADGAVGNLVQVSFDANHGGADEGWITAVDNVLVRALAAGDAQADGDVDPADLIQLLAGGAFGQGNIDATWGQGDFDNDGDFDGTDILAVVQGLAGEFPKTYAHDPSNGVPDVLINPATGNITLDTNGTTIGSIVMDSAAGIFNGPNSPSWDAPGDFAADIDTQISMPISFTNPGYTGVDDLGDGIIGDLAPGFDILADLTIKYLGPNGDLLDAEAHVVPEPSSMVLALLGLAGLIGYLRKRFTK